MFYNLLLAHLMADYPLQTGWIVANKVRWDVLGLHAAIHFLASVVLLWPVISLAWPYLLLLAAIHFMLDLAKGTFSRVRPNLVVLPYVVDQGCHLISIYFIARLIEGRSGPGAMPAEPIGVILLIAYLLVTYVWYITEQVLAHGDADYRQAIRDGYWARMAWRAGALSFILLIGLWLSRPSLGYAAIVLVPYRFRPYGKRALLIDIAVPAVVAALVLLTL